MVIDTAQRTLDYICAGHPPILLCHADDQMVWLGQAANVPLGIDASFAYQPETYSISPGDRLLLYSDGAYEAKNGQGQMFSLTRLATAFATAPHTPEIAIQSLRHTLANFSDAEILADDTTFFCVHASLSPRSNSNDLCP